ncbi:Methyltransferase domain-containing protein [Bradyrhizobium sp. NFR13]|uniref:class I SAM-dependent methyltransferase n=1 Tax=Bradyrhizobium sp. NFR13 TaxID=1566285 RepID=UPI0008EFC4E1|nr:class I SAM-dependent methyltransferase [Bradyrhizobium sp. NFR13]SFL39025.1 Methyltransferase domain-containing protein [Bradyrhizobium sp. NFR13]
MTDASSPSIRFNDGASYERMMGVWSRSAGEIFLEWMAPKPGLAWVDVGCGNGAFTQLIAERHAPAKIDGIDPSEPQLAYARTRPGAAMAAFHQGDAMALPFPDRSFDVAVMALVIFFVPEPARGVSEMVRVVSPGGTVAAYAWDMDGGGFPLEPILGELRKMGQMPSLPPSVDASRLDVMQSLWTTAGLVDVETRVIDVTRVFIDFEDFWEASSAGPSVKAALTVMSPAEIAQLKSRVRAGLAQDATGRVTCSARANAIKGRVPG